MIGIENKKYLKEVLNIDCDFYNEDKLNQIIDTIIDMLDEEIIKKERNVKYIKEEILALECN